MAREIILGKGGHARALLHVLESRVPSTADVGGPWMICEVAEGIRDSDILTWEGIKDSDILHVGRGPIVRRRAQYEKFKLQIPNRGIQVMERVHIGPNCDIGGNVLVNTGAQIDHDCVIGDHCVISPGAILCGGVKLGEACFIGAGAIIVENVQLAPETFVPAGTLVVGPDDFRRPQRVV